MESTIDQSAGAARREGGAMKVRTIENPIIKDKVTGIRTSEETNG